MCKSPHINLMWCRNSENVVCVIERVAWRWGRGCGAWGVINWGRVSFWGKCDLTLKKTLLALKSQNQANEAKEKEATHMVYIAHSKASKCNIFPKCLFLIFKFFFKNNFPKLFNLSNTRIHLSLTTPTALLPVASRSHTHTHAPHFLNPDTRPGWYVDVYTKGLTDKLNRLL